MKALILSAGLGTRLRPLTNNIPKTMVEIDHRPLLWYHIKHLKKHGVKDIWINLHWFPDVVKNYFRDGSEYGVKITYSIEKNLLGTSGALRNPDSNIGKELKKETFLVVYGDNLSNFDYTSLVRLHKSKKTLATIGLYKSLEPWTMGVVETNRQARVIAFTEKPPKNKVKSDLVFAGVMVCEPEILTYVPKVHPSDFGFDVLPTLLSRNKPLYALNTGSYVQDCGTHKRLSKARNDFKKKVVQFDFL